MIQSPAKWEEKDWGRTACLVDSPVYSLHHLEVKVGGYCSFHYHNERANRFIVESGIVRVVWAYGWSIKRRVLTPNNVLLIPSEVPHQFQVLEDGEMYEEYFPDRGGTVKNDDIVRLDKGGKVDVRMISVVVGVLKSDGFFWETGIG